MDTSRRPWLVPAAFILLGCLWGSSFLWIKIAVSELPPATLVALRMTLGAAAMLIFLRLIGQRLPRSPRELGHLAVMGALNSGVPIFMISWGEQYVDSGTAAVLNSLVPIYSLVIAGLIIRTESVTALRAAGVVVGFAGTAVLASREFGFSASPLAILGALAVAVAALFYALGASYAKYRIRTTHPYVAAGGALAFAALYLSVAAVFLDGGISLPTQPGPIAAVLWLGLLGSFGAYLLYFFLIQHVGATVSTMITYLFPVVGIALGVTFLGESLDLLLLAGTALVVLGIALVGLRYDAAVSLATRLARR